MSLSTLLNHLELVLSHLCGDRVRKNSLNVAHAFCMRRLNWEPSSSRLGVGYKASYLTLYKNISSEILIKCKNWLYLAHTICKRKGSYELVLGISFLCFKAVHWRTWSIYLTIIVLMFLQYRKWGGWEKAVWAKKKKKRSVYKSYQDIVHQLGVGFVVSKELEYLILDF